MAKSSKFAKVIETIKGINHELTAFKSVNVWCLKQSSKRLQGRKFRSQTTLRKDERTKRILNVTKVFTFKSQKVRTLCGGPHIRTLKGPWILPLGAVSLEPKSYSQIVHMRRRRLQVHNIFLSPKSVHALDWRFKLFFDKLFLLGKKKRIKNASTLQRLFFSSVLVSD